MSEKPILFSGPMIRALLAGTKTQTRRAMRAQPPADAGQVSTWHHPSPRPMFYAWVPTGDGGAEISEWPPVPCPYGAPGERLWVRETTRMRYLENLLTGEPTTAACGEYAADGEPVLEENGFDLAWWYSRKTCPAIHMPRWASRITLEVTGVRVERVQDISEADAIAEGVDEWARGALSAPDEFRAVDKFEMLWSQINGRASWDSNPWVWCIAFRRIEGLVR